MANTIAEKLKLAEKATQEARSDIGFLQSSPKNQEFLLKLLYSIVAAQERTVEILADLRTQGALK